MISQANSSAVRNAYTNSLTENKDVGKKVGTNVSSQGDMSKIERIKEALESGEYKINLQALSEKIADELL
ncbi:MAG: flagellar biosynthesis anti-sigma factor FlgM [Helicobacteraceae bacterium]|nr:flagellar biosynthesis anti-sigma factor FlgM [Candidatus Sulfurimonas ponti]MBL6973469.1 flagellar biosynthesis anti-sigma factor FlgM [Sulfurimonas sp.]